MTVDLRPQESEGLKEVCGLKFFYLAEDEKLFFIQWYANDKDAIVSGHKNSDVDNDHCASCFKKRATTEMRSGYNLLPYVSSRSMNSVFTIIFSPQS